MDPRSNPDSRKDADDAPAPASRVLEDAKGKAQRNGGERVPLGTLIDGTGPRIYGLALIAFALPEAIPFPAAGISGLVAIPLFIVCGWMMAFGMERRLPAWLRRRTIKRSWVEKAVEKGAPWVRRLERVSRPRLVHWAEAGRPIGTLCFALSLLMAVPLPFSNVPPGVCVLAIGLGVFQRDGALVLVASVAGLALIVGYSVLVFLIGRAVA